jgi:hypothetical protein
MEWISLASSPLHFILMKALKGHKKGEKKIHERGGNRRIETILKEKKKLFNEAEEFFMYFFMID